MKYYKLKKDLPTFKAGEEFYLNENGNLISVEKEPLVVYSRQTLDKFPNILKDWFEEISEVYRRWRVEKGGTYCFYHHGGWVERINDEGDEADKARYLSGNYTETEKESEKYGEYLKALQTIKDDTKGFVPDWKDEKQTKYYGYYSHYNGSLDWADDRYIQAQGAIYFRSKEDIKESFKKHRKEWMIVLGVEE